MSNIQALQIPTTATLTSSATPLISIAEAQAAASTWTDLPPTKTRDIISALETVARWLGRPPADLIFMPSTLRDGFLTKSPAAFGVSPGRKTNVKTLLGFAMHRLGLIDAPEMELSKTWTGLLAPLSAHQQINMKRLARFCHAHGLQPEDVTPATFKAFEHHLHQRTLTPRPTKLFREICGEWNKYVKSVPGWPQSLVSKRKDPHDFYVPLTAFPMAFQQSIADLRWHLSTTSLDDLYKEDPADAAAGEEDDQAPLPNCSPLAATAIANRLDHARWAACALAASGTPIENITDVRMLVQPTAHAQQILRFLHERAGRKPSSAGQHCADVLRIIARHYARSPATEIEKIKRWSKPVRLHYDGLTQNNQTTVRAVLVPAVEANLLALPEGLMRAARKLLAKSPKLACSLAMRALAIEFFTRVPVRLENLIELRLDKHLTRNSARSAEFTHAGWDVDEVKNALALSFPLSKTTRAMLAEWVKFFRPVIAEPGNPFLLPGPAKASAHVTPQGLRDAVKKATSDHLGVTITPHQFRHIAAARYLSEFPGEIEVARQFLGHKDIETTIGSYAGYLNEAAIARYDELLSNRLKSASGAKRKFTGGR